MIERSLYHENIKQRAKLLVACEDAEFQATTIAKCKRDILFWFENFAFTDRNAGFFPSDMPPEVPFILFPYQKDFVSDVWDAIKEGSNTIDQRNGPTNVFIEKSRQMGLSWLLVGIYLYGFLFHNHKYLMISQKEEDVDKPGNMKSLFEKIRFMIRMLPVFMLPPGFSKDVGTDYNKFRSINRGDGTGSITGESANPNASRGGTYNSIFMDEMATIANASQINTAASRATPCIIYNSTPNGKGNEYYRIREIVEKQWKAYEAGKLRYEDIGYRWHRIHWSENPFYTTEWYEAQKRSMTPEDVARELDINYNASVIGRIYPEFKEETYQIDYRDDLPLYVSIDNSHGGADPHAIVVCQPDGHWWNIIDYLEINCSVTDLANMFGRKPSMALSDAQLDFYNRYLGRKPAIFIADPYDTHSTLNTSTIFQEYARNNIFLNTDITKDKQEQIMKTRSNIYRYRMADFGPVRDLINVVCNARYPERPENSSSTSENNKPIHDWTSHGRSAIEYLTCFLLENDKNSQEMPKQKIEVRNYITGQLETKYI